MRKKSQTTHKNIQIIKDGQYKIILILMCGGHAAEDHNNQIDHLGPQPIIVGIIRMWPITNHKNKNAFLGTTFMCLDIQVYLKILCSYYSNYI